MKTAIYIEDGVAQLVITPETEFEKEAVQKFSGKPAEVQIFSGTFYDCRGGWVRQKRHYQEFMHMEDCNDKSLILRLTK